MTDDITFVRIGKNLIGLRGLKEIFQELTSRSGNHRRWPRRNCSAGRQAPTIFLPAPGTIMAGPSGGNSSALKERRRRRRTPPAWKSRSWGWAVPAASSFISKWWISWRPGPLSPTCSTSPPRPCLSDYNVRSFPALMINGRLVLAGQRPALAQLEKILLAHAGPDRTLEP